MRRIDSFKNIIELVKYLQEEGITGDTYRYYFDLYLETKARQNAIPLRGSFELTPFCNLDCKMCYVHLNQVQYGVDKLLPTNIWKSLMHQAIKAGMKKATLTGGECLTYPGFDELFLYLKQEGLRISVLSNGILIDRDRVEFFRKYPPDRIQVTLYGSSEDAYESVTGKRVFSKVFQNLKMLQEANLPVRISITPNKYMETDIDALLEKVDRMEIPYYINTSLIPPRDSTGRKKADMSLESYVKLYQKQYNLKHRELHPIDYDELPDENHNLNRAYGLRCGGGRSSFGIRYDGLMCPCFSLGEITVDVLEYGFKEAWNQINEKAQAYQRPAECEDCFYRVACFSCVALHKEAPQGHCNTNMCTRTKKMISTGLIELPK